MLNVFMALISKEAQGMKSTHASNMGFIQSLLCSSFLCHGFTPTWLSLGERADEIATGSAMSKAGGVLVCRSPQNAVNQAGHQKEVSTPLEW